MVLRNALRRHGTRELDVMLVSHGDSDHAGGVARLEQWVPAKRIVSDVPELPQPREACHRVRPWRFGAYRFSVPGLWFLIAVVVALIIGFFGGQKWLDWLSRRRHGGFVVR